jgi:hypothetical protein
MQAGVKSPVRSVAHLTVFPGDELAWRGASVLRCGACCKARRRAHVRNRRVRLPRSSLNTYKQKSAAGT